MLDRTNVLIYLGDLATANYTSGTLGYLPLLEGIEHLVVSPDTDPEGDLLFNTLNAVKQVYPDLKIYGYTDLTPAPTTPFSAWLTAYAAWQGSPVFALLDGIFIDHFYAGEGAATAATRVNQNLAVTAAHNDEKVVFGAYVNPEMGFGALSLEGAAQVTCLLGQNAGFTDLFLLTDYWYDLGSHTLQGATGRRGHLAYLRAAQENLHLKAAVEVGAGSTATYLDSDVWEDIRQEIDEYDINLLAVSSGERSLNRDWYWRVNQRGSMTRYPGPDYCRLYGELEPTVYGETASATLSYRRTDFALGDKAFAAPKGEVAVVAAEDGTWEVLLAAQTGGTKYDLVLQSGAKKLCRTLTLTAGQSVEFK